MKRHLTMVDLSRTLVAAAGLLAATPFASEAVWQNEVVDVLAGACAMALDDQDRPHMSYYGGGDLKYAIKDAGVWTIETVDAPGDVGNWSSIAIDSQGDPHISYYDATGQDLKYASRTGGTWTIEVVASNFDGQRTSLALDAADRPYISYTRPINSDLMLATKDGELWSTEIVENGLNVSMNSLALDSQGEPHIAYWGYVSIADGNLYYTQKLGGLWEREVVESDGDVGAECSLALDGGDNPHISYLHHTPGLGDYSIRYAARSAGALQGTWIVESIDTDSDLGPWKTSIALDAGDTPHVSYGTSGNPHLKYAHRTGGVWTIEAVNGNNEGGAFSKLAFDSNSDPHIGYSGDGLRYAVNPSPPVSVPDMPKPPLALGRPHPNPSIDGWGAFILSLEHDDTVALELYDVGGRLVAHRPPEVLPHGVHRMSWRPDVGAPGVYFVRAVTKAGHTVTRSWVLSGSPSLGR